LAEVIWYSGIEIPSILGDPGIAKISGCFSVFLEASATNNYTTIITRVPPASAQGNREVCQKRKNKIGKEFTVISQKRFDSVTYYGQE